jgi:hypothetical protein
MAISDHVLQFSIAYLNPDWAEKSRDTVLSEAFNWLEQRGNDKRDYKNGLAFVVPNKVQMDKARKGARTALAIASLIEQKAKYNFTAEDTEELTSKAKDAASEVGAALRRLYDYILLPLPCKEGTNPIRLETIDLQSQLNTSQNLQERVLDALKNNVFDSIKPAKLVQHSGLENSETGYIKGEELVSYFFRFPSLPKMLDVSGIQKAVVKAIEQGLIGYVPSMSIHPSGTTPTVENQSLISFERVIPDDELDLSGYILSRSLATQLRTPIRADNEPDTTITKPDDKNDISGTGTASNTWNDFDSTTQKLVGENKKTVEYKSETSSLSRSVLVDIVNGEQPARHYKLSSIMNKSQIFQLFEVLQALSDKADDMTIQIEVRAHTNQEFDPNWIRNAIEEPLDEMDIQASTRLE